MAVVASATGVALGMTAGTIGAGLVGGAVLGAGAGALYSAVTKDGNILDSALTGALIGGGVGGIGAAAGPALMGEAAAGTVGSAGATPALTAAANPVYAGGSAFGGVGGASVPLSGEASVAALEAAASGSITPATVAPATASNLINTQMPNNFMTSDASSFGAGWGPKGFEGGPQAGITPKEMLGYGLAGTAALSLLGGMNQPKLSETTGTNPSYIRPYTYSQTKNPNYGEPGQSYYNQSYTAQPAYQAKNGGVIRMAAGGLPAIQTNMYPQSQEIRTNFATPTQMPTSAEILASDYDTAVSPYTGEMARMADGGVAIDPNAQAAYVPAQVNPAMQVGIVPAPAMPSTYAPATGSAQATVDNMYRNVLGRRPEASGQQFWMDKVNEGVPTDDIRKAFSTSPERQQKEALRGQVDTYNNLLAARANEEYNKTLPPANMMPGGKYGRADIANQVTQNYQDLLGRAPDQAGLDFWTNRGLEGAKLNDIKNAIGTSNEYFNLHPESISGNVSNLYKGVLGREADQPGLDYWSNQIKSGMSFDDVQKAFRSSQELANPVTANPVTGGVGGPSQADIDAYLAANPTTVRTYDAKTQKYVAPNVTQAQIDAWKARTAGNTDLFAGMDPAVLQTMYTDYQRNQQNQGGGANGGMMPNALRYANGGGIAGAYNLGSYSDGGRLLKGPGDGVSDDIPAVIGQNQPARLAEGEFVIPARIVSELGNGSTDAGAKRLYAMMDNIQAGRKKTIGKDNVAKDTKAKKHLLA